MALNAVQALTSAGAQYLIHCGDVGTEAVLDALVGEVPSAFVFGNTDWDRTALERYAAAVGVLCLGTHGTVELAGKRIAVMHGDDFRLRATITEAQQHDYLMLGHTHVPDDRRVGRTRVINPGALYRAREKTAALLDLSSDHLRYLTIPE